MVFQAANFGLRPWQRGDENYLAFHANNYNIWKALRDIFPHPYTFDDAVSWIDKQLTSKPVMNFAIVVDDEPIGNISVNRGLDIHKMNMELGYWLSEDYWGQGITTEAIGWMVEYAFSEFEIKRLWASVFAFNKASARVLIKNGFSHEASLKSAVFKNNTYCDEYIFSIVR